MSSQIDPSRLMIRDFGIQKIAWNTYEIDNKKVKGKFRMLSVMSDLYEIPAELLPPGSNQSQFQPTFGNISRFLNEGEKGESDKTPLTQEEFNRRPREDITSFVKNRDEPLNEYVVLGDPPLLLTTQMKLARISFVRFRWNSFGDPILVAESNTTHTVGRFESGKDVV